MFRLEMNLDSAKDQPVLVSHRSLKGFNERELQKKGFESGGYFKSLLSQRALSNSFLGRTDIPESSDFHIHTCTMCSIIRELF